MKRPFPRFFASWAEIIAIVAVLILCIISVAIGVTHP